GRLRGARSGEMVDPRLLCRLADVLDHRLADRDGTPLAGRGELELREGPVAERDGQKLVGAFAVHLGGGAREVVTKIAGNGSFQVEVDLPHHRPQLRVVRRGAQQDVDGRVVRRRTQSRLEHVAHPGTGTLPGRNVGAGLHGTLLEVVDYPLDELATHLVTV